MSKRTRKLLDDLWLDARHIERQIQEMQKTIGVTTLESAPEEYRRWYLSRQSVQNLQGYSELMQKKIDEYRRHRDQKLWRRIFRRKV